MTDDENPNNNNDKITLKPGDIFYCREDGHPYEYVKETNSYYYCGYFNAGLSKMIMVDKSWTKHYFYMKYAQTLREVLLENISKAEFCLNAARENLDRHDGKLVSHGSEILKFMRSNFGNF